MIINPILVTLAIIYLFFPDFVVNSLNFIIQRIFLLWDTIYPFLIAESISRNSIFDTVAQVLAGILAIVFSISLFVIQQGSEKYSHKIVRLFRENRWTQVTFGFSLFSIIFCIFFVMLDYKNYVLYGMCFIFFFISIILFVKYYFTVIRIMDPEQIANLLSDECIQSIKNQDIDSYENVLSALIDVIIKLVREKNRNLLDLYIITVQKIYYEIDNSNLEPTKKLEFKGKLFKELFRVFQFAITEGDDARKDMIIILTQAIQSGVYQ